MTEIQEMAQAIYEKHKALWPLTWAVADFMAKQLAGDQGYLIVNQLTHELMGLSTKQAEIPTTKHKPHCLLLDPEEPQCHCSCGLEPAPAQTEQQPVATWMGTDWNAQQQLIAHLCTLEPGTDLYAAPIAQAAPQQPAYVECRECTDCGHVGINDAHQTDATCAMCDWSGPSPVEDQCPDCGTENVMGAACPKCSGRYRILAETHVAAPIAQTALPTQGAVEQ